ncbi:MAG: SAM hydrolase/SAM-dependent halogenase family protein [Bryobacteraceae bacterium]
MKAPLITLTTDFGLADHFAGTMKGVILGIAPAARIVDISHAIPAFAVTEAAFVIAQAAPYFPPKTVHVVVVDPGVGTSRRPILVEAMGQYFLGPDNGVLSMVYTGRPHKARHITAERYFLREVSRTFHGRDVFAPAAAHLARGLPPARLGKRVDDHLKIDFGRPVRTGKRAWTGTVLKVDAFGNLITNFHITEFPHLRSVRPVMLAGVRIVERLAENYAEAAPGEPVMIVGSSGYLEVAANQDSAARILGVGVGAPMELSLY